MTHEIQAHISSFEMNGNGLSIQCEYKESILYHGETERSLTSRYITAQIPESELPNLHIGQPITITFKTEA